MADISESAIADCKNLRLVKRNIPGHGDGIFLEADVNEPGSGRTVPSVLPLELCFKTGGGGSDIQPGWRSLNATSGFSYRARNVQLTGCILSLETEMREGWLFWAKTEWVSRSWNMANYVRVQNGHLEFKLHKDAFEKGIFEAFVDRLPQSKNLGRTHGAFAPAIGMMVGAAHAEAQKEEDEQNRIVWADVYKDGDYLIRPGWEATLENKDRWA